MRLIPIIPLLGVLIQAVVLILDRIDRATDWTRGYQVVARAAGGSGR